MIPIVGRDYELKLPKGHLSFSQIDLYLKCPQKYKRQYVDPKPEVRAYAVALAEGTAMTQTLEAIGLSILAESKKKKRMCLGEAKDLFTKIFQREAALVTHWNGEKQENTLARGLKMLDRYFGDEKPNVNDMHPITFNETPGTEHQWKIELAGVPVVGIADVVERNYVVDYKYSKNTRYLNADKSLQLTMNAVALERPKVAFLVFCKESGKVEWLPSTRDVKLASQWLTGVVANVARSISLGAFHMCSQEQNSLCSSKWCEYHADCFGAHGHN